MRPDLATMSDSSFSALICSLTARRIAVVDSLASTGMSITPFFSSARVSSSSLLIDAAVRRISSVASAKRLVADSTTSVIEVRILSVDASVRPSAFSSAVPTRFSNDFMTRSRSSDFLTSPTARSSSEDCRSSVCSKFDCAAPIRFDALASSLPCSSKRLAIAATSRSAACDSSVSRLVLASMSRAELAKVCAALSVVAENLSVVPDSFSSTAEQVGPGGFDQNAELRARCRKAADQVVDVLGKRPARAVDRGKRLGRAVGERVDQRRVLRTQPFGRQRGRRLQALLQFAAALGEAVDQRPRRLVEDLGDLGGAAGQHGVQLARVDADGLGRLVGALADMLADRGEGLGNDVGARHQLCLGLRNLLVDLLGHRFGAVGEPPFGLADLLGNPGRGGFGTCNHPLIGRGKCILDRAGAFGELRRGLMRAGDDLLFGLIEDAGNIGRARSERFGALADPRGDLAIDRIEDAPELDGAHGDRADCLVDTSCDDICGLVDTLLDLAIGGLEDLPQLNGATGDRADV